MGGMQALQWGVSDPGRMRSIVALVPMARTRAWAAAMNEVARRILTSDVGWPSGPYGAGFDAWAAQTRVITNRTPLALETVPTGSVPALVANAVATARNAGPDPVDWVYQSWAYDAHDVGTTRASAATRPQPCDRSGRLRCFWFRNWTSTIRSKMRSRLLR
jgi:homoserine O-acetyltransferase